MSSIFLDSLAVDIERMTRINATLALLTQEQRAQCGLRPIEMLTIAPSERLDEIASKHVGSLPNPIRLMLGVIGATDVKGSALASYLLFEASYTQELMTLGRRDAQAEETRICEFFEVEKKEAGTAQRAEYSSFRGRQPVQ
jgi:NTE family protein